MSDYLTVVEVLAMHADQIERYGGTQVSGIKGCWKPLSIGRRPVITPT